MLLRPVGIWPRRSSRALRYEIRGDPSELEVDTGVLLVLIKQFDNFINRS